LRKNNFNVIFICSYGKYFSKDEGYIKNLTWSKIASIFSKTKLVVGCDSAPIHMAGITNTKSIAILGPTTKNVFSHLPLVRCISIDKEIVPCVGCWFQNKFQQNPCSLGCVALSCITPQFIYNNVIEVINE
jgi:hypothetical protein